jgi:hypothetical protein
MRIIVCLLLAIAGGFGAYMLGAIGWSLIDPTGAGATLLFTIPVAIVGTAIPALLAVLILVNGCDLVWRKPVAKARPVATSVAASAKTRRPRSVPFRHSQPEPDLQLAVA